MTGLTKPLTSGILHRNFILEGVLDNMSSVLDNMVTVNLANYPNLRAAIDALPVFGGNVLIPVGAKYSGDYSQANPMTKPNVSLVGAKMPTWNSTLSKLEGGSVINGRFNVYADNFAMYNIGFDMGKDFCSVKYPSADFTTASHPLGGTWDAFAFGPQTHTYDPKKNLTAYNVIGLAPSHRALAHCLLFEGFSGGTFVNCTAIYGVHGVVFKGLGFTASGIHSYGQQQNGCIIKSNSYALCGRASLSGVYYNSAPDNTTPWDVPQPVWVALNFHAEDAPFVGAIIVNDTIAVGPARHVYFEGQVISSDVSIGTVITDGQNKTEFSVQLSNNASAPFARVNIGQVTATNCVTAVQVDQPSAFLQQQLRIGCLQVSGITGHGVVVGTNGSCVIDNYQARDVSYAYCVQGNGKLRVGNEDIINATAGKFSGAGGGFVPSLINGWANSSASESSFEVSLRNYKLEVKGTIKGGTQRAFMAVPANFMPSKTERHAIAGFNGVEFSPNYIELSGVTAGVVVLPNSNGMVFLDGLSWNY